MTVSTRTRRPPAAAGSKRSCKLLFDETLAVTLLHLINPLFETITTVNVTLLIHHSVSLELLLLNYTYFGVVYLFFVLHLRKKAKHHTNTKISLRSPVLTFEEKN
jgi:hypothetical protein